MEFVQPIRDKRQIEDMKGYLLEHKDYKYYVMFMLGINSALRVGDILSLRVRDIRKNGEIRKVVSVKAEKTDKIHEFPINTELRKLLKNYCNDKKDYEYLIANERTSLPIGRTQAWKVLKEVSKSVGIENIGTHSMRKTYGYHFYQETKDIVLLQEILGHSDIAITKRYIGLTRDTTLKAMTRFKL